MTATTAQPILHTIAAGTGMRMRHDENILWHNVRDHIDAMQGGEAEQHGARKEGISTECEDWPRYKAGVEGVGQQTGSVQQKNACRAQFHGRMKRFNIIPI